MSLFSDPHGVINSHLNSKIFCVTDDFAKARAFIERDHGGVLALYGEEITALNTRLIKIQNELIGQDYSRSQLNPSIRELEMDLDRLINTHLWPGSLMVPDTNGATKLINSVEFFTWEDPPHVDAEDMIAMLYGKARRTEIAAEFTVQNAASYSPIKENSKNANLEWIEFAPISFLSNFLILLLKNNNKNAGPLHRIPQKLKPNEERPPILTKRF